MHALRVGAARRRVVVAVDRPGGSTPTRSRRGRRPACVVAVPERQPRGRHAPAGRARSRPRRAAYPSSPPRASAGRLPLPGRVGAAAGLGAQVGRTGRGRACCSCARARAGATLPGRRPGRRAGVGLRERARPRWPPRRRCRRSWPSVTRSTRASTPSSTGSAPAWRHPRRRGRGPPRRAAPPRADVLVPLRRRRGAGDRARPAGFGVASGSACTASTLDAEPRAGGDGRPHPRQRPPVPGRRGRDRGRGRALPGRAPGVLTELRSRVGM